jgi:signal transduction histidine kinase/ActR/RegA family two-component response regulator
MVALDRLRTPLYATLFGAAYCNLGLYSVLLPVSPSGISYLWPAAGLALGVLLCTRVRNWPLYLLAIFLANIVRTANPTAVTLLYATLNVLEPSLLALVIARLLGSPPRLDTVRSLSAFFFYTTSLVALATLASNVIRWQLRGGDFWPAWLAWFASDGLGMLIVGPVVLALSEKGRAGLLQALRGRSAEALLIFAGLMVTTHLVYTLQPDQFGRVPNLNFLPVAIVFWAAMRFGLRGAALGMAIFSLQAFWYTSHQLGSFAAASSSPQQAMVNLQASVTVIDYILMLVAVVMSERQQAFAENRAWRKRVESAMAANEMLVCETDLATGTILWSGDTRAVLGIKRENVSDLRSWEQRLHPEDRASLRDRQNALSKGELLSASAEYRIRSDDGNYTTVGVAIFGVEIPSDNLTGSTSGDRRWVAFIKNITNKLRAAEERTQLMERLRQAEKTEAIGRLAGGIAHDFNNLLGAILGYGEMAQAKTQPGSDLRRYLDTIVSAGERGKALVAQILTFSRASPSEKLPVNIKALLDEILALLHGSLPQNVRLKVTIADENAVTLGDPTRLHQIIMNLCTNAVQAMPAGGELRISMRLESISSERALRSGALPPGRYIALDIEDQGEGMNSETLSKIFEPFFTTKPRGKGTGLGLATAHGIAVNHGGAIEVESRPGKGSRFTVYLPEAPVPGVVDDHKIENLPLGNGETILVVDDEAPMVELAETLLAELGYEPVGYTSSREALAAFEMSPGRFDAILTDEVMPELTGTELCSRIRIHHPHLPVLMVSGGGGAGFEIRAETAGITRILDKPYRKHEFAAALHAVLQQK